MKARTKGKKVNKAWLADHINDPYVKMAQKEGYRARAAYKLKEIDETLKTAAAGKLDVLIDTHRILSKDVADRLAQAIDNNQPVRTLAEGKALIARFVAAAEKTRTLSPPSSEYLAA